MVADINKDKFAEGAFIGMQGCNTAQDSMYSFGLLVNPITTNLPEHIPKPILWVIQQKPTPIDIKEGEN